jgi:aminoglycoside 2''-phosphotransferase
MKATHNKSMDVRAKQRLCLPACLFNSNGLGGGFAPRHLNCWALFQFVSCFVVFSESKLTVMSKLESYEKRIREIRPEIVPENLELNTTGLLNDVVIVNDEFVFRFVKRDFGYKDPQEEAKILNFLKKHITLPIPTPFYQSSDVLAYRLIRGETLRRDVLMRLSEDDQQAIADQLARFFKELHNVPINELTDFELPKVPAQMNYDGWKKAYGRIREKVFPLLMPHTREWATEHFESYLAEPSNFECDLTMIHGDIPPYHVIFDRQQTRIGGVIDFGSAGLGDPAIDFGSIVYHYGESLMTRFYKIYAEAETYLKRARFFAGEKEIRWLLTGIERNDVRWFAIHVGSAKDVRYNTA